MVSHQSYNKQHYQELIKPHKKGYLIEALLRLSWTSINTLLELNTG